MLLWTLIRHNFLNGNSEQPEIAVIRIPPLALVTVTALLMWGITILVPSMTYTFTWSKGIAIAVSGVGLVICLAAVLEFRRAQTTVNPLSPGDTSTLVISGVYQLSRNPMYLGFLLMLAGWAIWLGNAISAMFIFGFFIYIDRFQIPPEEQALCSAFGNEFREYKQSVRRWL